MTDSNIYGVILAGGAGSRMGDPTLPKQYMNIGGMPIIVHTIQKMCMYAGFSRIVIACPKQWIEHTRGLASKYMNGDDRIEVIGGGGVRNETIMNAIAHIEKEYGLDNDTIIVTHDAVRPFVTYRIIDDNVRAARAKGACDTVIPATDTIVESVGGELISAIPDRSVLYQGQTPQSFRAKELKELYGELTEGEKAILTDAAKIFVLKGKDVGLVKGETFNIKITYPYDISIAEALLKGDVKC